MQRNMGLLAKEAFLSQSWECTAGGCHQNVHVEGQRGLWEKQHPAANREVLPSQGPLIGTRKSQ